MRMLRYFFTAMLCFLFLGCDRSEKLTTADGKSLKLTESDKRYRVINYWASWCTSCKQEVISMNKLYQQFGNQLLILGVDFDGEKGNTLLSAIHKLDIHYPVIVSNIAEKWHLPEPEVLPTTYLLSPTHQIIQVFYGKKAAGQLKQWLTHV